MNNSFVKVVIVVLAIALVGCGKDSGSSQSEVESSRGGADVTGTWQDTGTGFGSFRSATMEITADFIQIDVVCAGSRGTVFSPIELRSNSLVVKETHASAPPCVAALTKGEKGFKLSGDSLILDGVLGSSRWRR